MDKLSTNNDGILRGKECAEILYDFCKEYLSKITGTPVKSMQYHEKQAVYVPVMEFESFDQEPFEWFCMQHQLKDGSAITKDFVLTKDDWLFLTAFTYVSFDEESILTYDEMLRKSIKRGFLDDLETGSINDWLISGESITISDARKIIQNMIDWIEIAYESNKSYIKA